MSIRHHLHRIGPAVLSFLVALPAVLAWSTPGHMATGSVVFKSLETEPGGAAAMAEACRILEQHPFVTGPWAGRLAEPGAVSRAERLFMLAAQWPDEVRSGAWSARYHHADWHYVNLRYTAGKANPGPVMAGSLLEQVEANLRMVRDTTATGSDRAIALCWVFHLVGDLHQPLHVTALVSKKYPKGDRGGNEFYVRPAAGRAPRSTRCGSSRRTPAPA